MKIVFLPEGDVSGMRPTGRLHLGNYWGALKNWVDLQEKYDCFFFVADWHVLTTATEKTEAIRENARLMVIDWLAAGLDPQKCVFFRQSEIKASIPVISRLVFAFSLPQNEHFSFSFAILNVNAH